MKRRAASAPLLTIAGSDPTAGAGVEADLLTFARFGRHGVAAITALTTQDTSRVHRVGATEHREFRERLHTLLVDVRPRAWKIGLVPTAAHARSIAEAIAEFAPRFVVLDPIVAATAGARFLDRRSLDVFRNSLLPKTTILTPNRAEAAVLLGMTSNELDRAPDRAANRLLELGPRAVLLKGGHAHGRRAIDLLATSRGLVEFATVMREGERRDVHGTGCALSAAILAALDDGHPLARAVARAKRFVTRAIDDSIAIGAGRRRLGLVSPRIRRTAR